MDVLRRTIWWAGKASFAVRERARRQMKPYWPCWKVVIDGTGHGFFAQENPTETSEGGFRPNRDFVAYVTTDDPTEAVRRAYARRARALH
jgi:hypothetical protein